MKPQAAWFEASCGAGALLAGMLLVMWVQHPVGCTLAPEPSRRLVLDRETDREHLTSDLESVDRIARRYAASIPGGAQQRTRFLECQASLIQQITTKHSVPRDRLVLSAR
jgi:hypothetical protein